MKTVICTCQFHDHQKRDNEFPAIIKLKTSSAHSEEKSTKLGHDCKQIFISRISLMVVKVVSVFYTIVKLFTCHQYIILKYSEVCNICNE